MCLRSSAAMKSSHVVAVSMHESNSALARASMSACHMLTGHERSHSSYANTRLDMLFPNQDGSRVL